MGEWSLHAKITIAHAKGNKNYFDDVKIECLFIYTFVYLFICLFIFIDLFALSSVVYLFVFILLIY